MNVNPSKPQVIRDRWIPAKAFAEIHSFPVQTLANWRHLDRKAGRNEAGPGYPTYKRFGKAVRYLLPAQPEARA